MRKNGGMGKGRVKVITTIASSNNTTTRRRQLLRRRFCSPPRQPLRRQMRLSALILTLRDHRGREATTLRPSPQPLTTAARGTPAGRKKRMSLRRAMMSPLPAQQKTKGQRRRREKGEGDYRPSVGILMRRPPIAPPPPARRRLLNSSRRPKTKSRRHHPPPASATARPPPLGACGRCCVR